MSTITIPGTTTLQSESELDELASALMSYLGKQVVTGATLLTLTGDLGAGKTALVKALGRQLHVTSIITSPTFVIMKRYEIDHPLWDELVHIDAYRFIEEEEAKPLHFETLFATPRLLICLEWPDRIKSLIATDAVAMTITQRDGEERIFTVT